MWQNFLQKCFILQNLVKLCFLQFSKPKELCIPFFFFSFPPSPKQFSIYRNFPKCVKALIGDMFVKDFQLEKTGGKLSQN
jgi:hypothetical protein